MRLTTDERRIIDAAEAIILAHMPKGASLSLSAAHYEHTAAAFSSSAYFTAVHRSQHMLYHARTLADIVQAAMAIQADEYANEGAYKAERIAKLQAELAALEGDA